MLQVILLIVPLEALQEFCCLDDDRFRKVRGRMELLPVAVMVNLRILSMVSCFIKISSFPVNDLISVVF